MAYSKHKNTHGEPRASLKISFWKYNFELLIYCKNVDNGRRPWLHEQVNGVKSTQSSSQPDLTREPMETDWFSLKSWLEYSKKMWNIDVC